MAEDMGGGYTGVVDTEVAAPFTGADGYSGVVYSDFASGFTGLAAPAGPAAASTQAPVTAAPAQTGPGVTPSPYDQAIMTGGSAPGSSTATSYAPPPPDLTDQDLQAMADAAAPADSGGLVIPEGTDHVAQVDELIRHYADTTRQVQLVPTNKVKPLIGRGADWLANQAAQAIASVPPSTLDQATLQGLVQEAVAGTIATGAGLAQNAADNSFDSVGNEFEKARQLIDAIRDRMRKGEGFWKAVNSSFNPAVQALNEGRTANQLASQAVAAQQAGHWDEAVWLARLAGRSTFRSWAATASTVATAMDAAKAGGNAVKSVRAWRQRPPGQLTAPPELPPRPESEPLTARRQPPRPAAEPPPTTEPAPSGPTASGEPGPGTPRSDGLTGTAVHGEGGPEAPELAPATTPYPAFPQVDVPSPGFLRAKLEALSALYKRQQADLADRMAALPPSQRLKPEKRNLIAKAAISTKEKMTTAWNQLAHPDRAYLDQVTLDVVTGTGEIIEGADVPGVGQGRELDGVALYPDRTWDPLEYKTSQSTLNAYPAGPNVTVPGFKPSTPLGDQLARQQKIIDYAKSNGYQLRLSGTPVGGGPRVDVLVSPGSSRGGQVVPYFQIPN
jgi:hypothetical protein